VFALSGVMAAWLANHVDPAIGIVGGVVVGLVVGMANGVLVVAGLNSFLATLASSLVIRGLAVVITGGLLITVSDEAFGAIGKDDVLGLRYAIVALILVAGTLWFVTARTAFGRYVYAIGGNEEAARLSGVRVGLVRCGTFAISGGCAGLAGVLAASLASTGQADMGVGLELDAIAAVVIGGTSILGGVGAVWRTILGVFLLALVVNGFNLLNLPPYTQDIFTGTIIVAAIALNSLSGRR
jgi:ribose transport system permease protein